MNIITIMLTALNLAGLTGQGGLSDLASPTEFSDSASLSVAAPAALATPAISSCLEPDFVLVASGYGDDDLFTGDKRLACEAILCLSSPARPSECSAAISRYFGIKRYKNGNFNASRTKSARKAFLDQCPNAGADAYVQNVTGIISNTLNQCDAGYLNSRKIYYARAFDVLQGKWSNWKLLGKNNQDQGSGSRYTLNQAQFPACSARQFNYAANLAAGKETPPRYHPEAGWTYPVELTCYETRAEIDPNPPADCAQLFASDYTYYKELKYENGTWVYRD